MFFLVMSAYASTTKIADYECLCFKGPKLAHFPTVDHSKNFHKIRIPAWILGTSIIPKIDRSFSARASILDK